MEWEVYLSTPVNPINPNGDYGLSQTDYIFVLKSNMQESRSIILYFFIQIRRLCNILLKTTTIFCTPGRVQPYINNAMDSWTDLYWNTSMHWVMFYLVLKILFSDCINLALLFSFLIV